MSEQRGSQEEPRGLNVGDLRAYVKDMDERIPVKVLRSSGDRRVGGSQEVVMIAEQEGSVVMVDRNSLERMLGREDSKAGEVRASYEVEEAAGGFGVLNLEQTLERVRQMQPGEGMEVSRGRESRPRELLRRIAADRQAIAGIEGSTPSGYAVSVELMCEVEGLLGHERE